MPDPVAVNSMFARIARRYDVANRFLSGGMDIWWRRCLVRRVQRQRPRDVLDLATGSGDVAFALARQLPENVAITGLDFCQPMLDEAEIKKATAGPGRYRNVAFRQADALALPVPDESVDAVTISFGLRNMADRAQALREMRRVLRPNGRVYVLEFSQPQWWFRPLYYFYLLRISPRLAALVTGQRGAYDYLGDSISHFPNGAGLAQEIGAVGFSDVTFSRLTFGIVALHEATK